MNRNRAYRKPDEYVIGEVCTLFGVSPRTVVKWVDSENLPAHRLPNGRGKNTHRRFRKSDLVAFAERMGLPNPFAKIDTTTDRNDVAVALMLWRNFARLRPQTYGDPARVSDRALSLAASLGVKTEYLDILAKGEL